MIMCVFRPAARPGILAGIVEDTLIAAPNDLSRWSDGLLPATTLLR